MQRKQLALEQGSPQWLEYRHRRIGGSDAGAIMGVNAWKTRLQLFKEKTRKKPLTGSAGEAAARGHKLEIPARAYYELLAEESFPPVVFENDLFPFALASLDGFSERKNAALEIKCPSNLADHLEAKRGDIPRKYYWQCMHILMVTAADYLDYLSFSGSDGIVLRLERNDADIEILKNAEIKFWDCVCSRDSGGLGADDGKN